MPKTIEIKKPTPAQMDRLRAAYKCYIEDVGRTRHEWEPLERFMQEIERAFRAKRIHGQ